MAREWRILSAVMMAQLCSAASFSIIVPGLATWLRLFGSAITVGWIMSSYLLMSAAAAALCGKLGDVYGRKPVLLAVLCAIGIGALISFSSDSAEIIIAGRALQGVAGAILPLCFALAREHLPLERFPFAAGLIIAAGSGGAAFAVLLGGFLVDRFGPGSLFVVIASFAFGGALVLRMAIPESTAPRLREKIDWLGGVLFAPGVAALLLAVSSIRSAGLASATVAGWASAGVLILLVWHLHERKQANPMVDLRLIGGRERGLANAVMVCMGMGAMQLSELLSLLIQQDPATGVGLGQSASVLGSVRAPAVICGVIGSLWAGWIAARRGASFPMVAGGCTILTVLLVTLANHGSLPLLVAAMVVFAIGMTAIYSAIPMVVIANTDAAQAGAATGLMAVLRALSQGVGAQLVAVLLASSTVLAQNGTNYPDATGYVRALTWMAASAALVVVLAIVLRRISLRSAAAEGTEPDAAADNRMAPESARQVT